MKVYVDLLKIKKKKYLFIVSHMRSYSTLLSHILGTNEQISGYAEMKQKYKNKSDLIKLNIKIYKSGGYKMNSKYLLDKILHNKYYIYPSIISENDVYIIFLLRNPQDTITSIVNQSKELNYEKFFNYENATKYYINRVKYLIAFANNVNKENSLFITSEEFIKKPEDILSKIKTWLGLKNELSIEYNIFKLTGIPGYGDIKNILYGKIMKKINEQNRGIEYNSNYHYDKAFETYIKCKRILLKSSQYLSG